MSQGEANPIETSPEAPPPQGPIHLTSKAVRMVVLTREEEKLDPVSGLRVAVRGGGCSGRVEKALRAVEGVDKVVVELDPGRATVFGAAEAETLKSAVREIGFTVPG